jgi:hypothetical protein
MVVILSEAFACAKRRQMRSRRIPAGSVVPAPQGILLDPNVVLKGHLKIARHFQWRESRD